MESENIFTAFRQLIQGKIKLKSFFLILLGFFIAWLISTSVGGIIQEKAVYFYDEYAARFLGNTLVPVWVLILISIVVLVIGSGIGIIIGRRNYSGPANTNKKYNHLKSLGRGNDGLFQDLIDEVEENPTGLPHGKLWKLIIQLEKNLISEQEYAARITTILNNQEINERTARKFLLRCGFSLKHDGAEYIFLRKLQDKKGEK